MIIALLLQTCDAREVLLKHRERGGDVANMPTDATCIVRENITHIRQTVEAAEGDAW
jgi:hypothetical protein